MDTIGEVTADLRSNIAAEARAKILYERLINLTDDVGVKDALGFLMTREVAHQISFEKALYAISNNFPPGKMPPIEKYATVYYNMSEGNDMRGSWNSDENFTFVANPEPAVDGGDGSASVTLSAAQKANLDNLANRTASDPSVNPVTGTDLGSVPPVENEAVKKGTTKRKTPKK
ncbi:manganese catalase [Buttiauxella agrestis ATCC 33320]|uniref:Manganese catalase n=1 Tax=Buttiauxella agrestis ATCC 33320 TaxID=1006004 RepID=A0A085GDV5_9ENTR|nr:manganese catalase [Buttiauxella agrestis ATCC 33320]